MPRRVETAVIALALAVIIGAFYFPKLRQRVLHLAHPERTEEQTRREVVQPPIATPTDVKVKATVFWASTVAPAALEPVQIEMPLSADPAQRSKQLINALIAEAPSAAQRTLPADTTLLELYLLPDGTAVADFSDTLSTKTPSGILSEQMVVDSIARTLAANVEPMRRLKILIHGQETETLAGHVDLTNFFPARVESQPQAPGSPAAPVGKAPAPAPAAVLTPPMTPGKLRQ